MMNEIKNTGMEGKLMRKLNKYEDMSLKSLYDSHISRCTR